MESLEPRKEMILRAVIVEYVSGAEPIASDLITVKYQLGVKSATVRNELAEMAELGFLEQPHSSAGRIPSDKGYRYYVDHLSSTDEVSEGDKKVLRKPIEEGDFLQTLLSHTTRHLSRMTHLLSAATTIRGGHITVRSAGLSAFGPHQSVLVLGLSNGEVLNRIVECPANLTLVEIGLVNESLQKELVGKSVRSAQKLKSPSAPAGAAEKLMLTCWTNIKSLLREFTRGSLVTHGEEFLFGQPEFSRNAIGLSDLIDQVKESEILFESLSPSVTPQPDSLGSVTIGKENRHEELHRLSIVKQTFYVGNTEAGTVGVIGPTRMNYDLSIPVVQFTAAAISDALTRMSREF